MISLALIVCHRQPHTPENYQCEYLSTCLTTITLKNQQLTVFLPHPLVLPHPNPRCYLAQGYCYKPVKDRSSYSKHLLLRSGIEPNPGPRKLKYPCGICYKACKDRCIACDDCDQWMHKSCIGLTTAEFSALGKSTESWSCPSCLKPHNSSILYTVPAADEEAGSHPGMQESVSDISHSTRYSSTSTENDTASFLDSFDANNVATSSPKVKLSRPKAKVKNLRVLNINFQSLRRKESYWKQSSMILIRTLSLELRHG